VSATLVGSHLHLRHLRHRPLQPVAWPTVDLDGAPTLPLLAEEWERAAHRAAVEAQDRANRAPGFDWAALAVGAIVLVGAMYVVIALLRWWA
jgi:hypothetical protein